MSVATGTAGVMRGKALGRRTAVSTTQVKGSIIKKGQQTRLPKPTLLGTDRCRQVGETGGGAEAALQEANSPSATPTGKPCFLGC
mmetsp:Transcript_23227/g.35011  ORF Transcript_23227/g.35011 Transcript_23227/m.35011 type:complete len:85 (+) Transcript_23227:27-281(+)